MTAPIPVHVVTGALGSGKTTAIARLLATKPPAQNWVVLLNEFSEAGIDALTVASAARGAFDVRLVPGGCLCCAGEADFRRNLHDLATVVRPDRIVIEPSGLGHPGGIVDELLGYESRGALRLAGIVALVDPRQLRAGGLNAGSDAFAQVEIADSLALSKADLADDADRGRFSALVASLFPAKVWSGPLLDGEIPPQAFEPAVLHTRDGQRRGRPPAHLAERETPLAARHPHAASQAVPGNWPMAGGEEGSGSRVEVRHLGHRALSWRFPRAVEFSRRRLEEQFESAACRGDGTGPGHIARLKGVFRVGEDDWLLAQAGDGFLDLRPTSWRRDSRVELLVHETEPLDAVCWDATWLHCRRR